jgi:hypothetical protein
MIDRAKVRERKFDLAWIDVGSVENLGLGNSLQSGILNYEC